MPEAAVARSGLGFDVHRFAAGRDLWLGGVRFDGEDGLMGHSDGDAVCHAVADALLGASALGDVGEHFPDSDAAYEGLSGSELLGQVVALVVEAGFTPTSCDVTVVCDRPAIAPRRDEMRAHLGQILSLAVERVSVKATRPEGLGLAGDGIGCLAIAVVT
jgi:2-C-methyl-D-erythritol 2,4-cyclodiphosphate synthase